MDTEIKELAEELLRIFRKELSPIDGIHSLAELLDAHRDWIDDLADRWNVHTDEIAEQLQLHFRYVQATI